MKVLLVMCVVVIYFTDSVYNSPFNDLINLTPLWDSITSTWNKMVFEIKKPVRLRRLGSIGKRKTTTACSSTPKYSASDIPTKVAKDIPTGKNILFATEVISSPYNPASIEIERRRIPFQENGFPEPVAVPGDGKVKLPYLPEPIWKTLEDWRRMQLPRFAKIVKDENDKDFEAPTSTTENKLSTTSVDLYGFLFFIRG